MIYTYTTIYVTADGRKNVVNCGQSSNIALAIARIQLNRGAQSAEVSVTMSPGDPTTESKN